MWWINKSVSNDNKSISNDNKNIINEDKNIKNDNINKIDNNININNNNDNDEIVIKKSTKFVGYILKTVFNIDPDDSKPIN